MMDQDFLSHTAHDSFRQLASNGILIEENFLKIHSLDPREMLNL